MEYNKKFVIIGSMNAITYKEIFPLLQQDKMWLGYSHPKRFIQPDGTEKVFGNIMWYTNLELTKHHEPLDLRSNRYYDDPSIYPKYDNYDAIECSKVNDIPEDYDGVIGVPITFLDKYCPEQWEILGATESEGKGFSNGLWKSECKVAQPLVQGQKRYKRIFIRRRPAIADSVISELPAVNNAA